VLKGVSNVVVHDAVKDLTFTDEATAINAAVAPLRAQGADVLVVLIHEGGVTSQTAFDDTTCPDFHGALIPILDRLDPAIDVVISGHTHRTYICRRNGRLITSAGSQGRYVTDVELAIDPRRRRVVDMSARQVAVTKNPDSKVQAIVDTYTAAAAPLTQRAVAAITADITRETSPARESALGDLIADAQLAITSAPTAGGAQIAFMNSAGIRTDLRAQDGGVTYGAIYAVHPFGNALVTLTLSGAQIHELLEEQWSGSASLQVSQGFSYEWQAGAAPGAKVDPASICLNGVTLDPAKRYRVTVNEFLAGGGDGFTVLTSGTDPLRGPLDAEALEAYLHAHSPISPPASGRIGRK